MWAGRFEKATDKVADDFNSSIHFDSKMYRQDIRGSIEHAKMLCRVGILTELLDVLSVVWIVTAHRRTELHCVLDSGCACFVVIHISILLLRINGFG